MGRVKGEKRFTAENPGELGEVIITDLVGVAAPPKKPSTKTWHATFSVRGWQHGVQRGVTLRVTTDSRAGYNVFTSYLSPSAARELVRRVRFDVRASTGWFCRELEGLDADRKLAKWLVAAFKSALKRQAP